MEPFEYAPIGKENKKKREKEKIPRDQRKTDGKTQKLSKNYYFFCFYYLLKQKYELINEIKITV